MKKLFRALSLCLTLALCVSGSTAALAEAPAATHAATSVLSEPGAYAAETTAVAPEDPAGSQEELDGSYALLEDEDGFGATVDWVGDADPYGIALLAAGATLPIFVFNRRAFSLTRRRKNAK